MNYKPFNLEQAKAQNGEGLITRDGRPARIVCWDLKNTDKPIVAIITATLGEEYSRQFRLDGLFYRDGDKSPCDLFLAPTKHEGWVNVYRENGSAKVNSLVYGTEKEADYNAIKAVRVACVHIEWEE